MHAIDGGYGITGRARNVGDQARDHDRQVELRRDRRGDGDSCGIKPEGRRDAWCFKRATV
jgi:hypothetical protein